MLFHAVCGLGARWRELGFLRFVVLAPRAAQKTNHVGCSREFSEPRS